MVNVGDLWTEKPSIICFYCFVLLLFTLLFDISNMQQKWPLLVELLNVLVTSNKIYLHRQEIRSQNAPIWSQSEAL